MTRRAALALALLAAACGGDRPLDRAEVAFEATRYLADQIDVTVASGTTVSRHGVPLDSLMAEYREERTELVALLAAVDTLPLGAEDRRAWRTMRRVAADRLGEDPAPAIGAGEEAPGEGSCDYEPAAVLQGPDGPTRLSARIVRCYGIAAGDIRLAGEPDRLDRLTIFGRLGTTPDPARRRRLFLALQPVWRSVNADDGASASPWRLLLQPRVEGWRSAGFPHVARARALGVDPDSVEPWLVRALEAWRASLPDSLVEPWDWYYANGEVSRRLSPRVPLDSLLPLNRAIFASLGAHPDSVGVEYDIAPRDGKYPVAYSSFGARTRGTGPGWTRGEPWVFASYRTGGLGNLGELLHETGHAVHIGAIEARPAFNSWPDSDTFTEAIADVVALDLFEPSFQQRWLGDSVSRGVALRGKYGSVMLDLAWALFEIRMFREPDRSPNEVWAGITSTYLGIRPHPEWSWWAQRAQLIESPGYMLNYALGAILIAQLRDRIQAERGAAPGADDPGWYRWMADRLYRYGLTRPTAGLVEEFLGGPVSPNAILADLGSGQGVPPGGQPR